jgi:hypothetical protein
MEPAEIVEMDKPEPEVAAFIVIVRRALLRAFIVHRYNPPDAWRYAAALRFLRQNGQRDLSCVRTWGSGAGKGMSGHASRAGIHHGQQAFIKGSRHTAWAGTGSFACMHGQAHGQLRAWA